ncbi:MAG: hypothetical protein MJ066_05840 [Clostridia bacterium]|nr:hypothetical protein [Clostridia bacterium]
MIYIIRHRKETQNNILEQDDFKIISRDYLKNIIDSVKFFNNWKDVLPYSYCKMQKAHYNFKYHYEEFLPTFDFNKCDNTTYTTIDFWYLETSCYNNIAYLWRSRKNPLKIDIKNPDLSEIVEPEAKAIILSLL